MEEQWNFELLFQHFLTRIIYFTREANERSRLVEIKTSNRVFSNRVYRFCSRFRVYDIIFTGFLSKYPRGDRAEIDFNFYKGADARRVVAVLRGFAGVSHRSAAMQSQYLTRLNCNFVIVGIIRGRCVCVQPPLEREDTSFRIVHVTHIENMHNRRGLQTETCSRSFRGSTRSSLMRFVASCRSKIYVYYRQVCATRIW